MHLIGYLASSASEDKGERLLVENSDRPEETKAKKRSNEHRVTPHALIALWNYYFLRRTVKVIGLVTGVTVCVQSLFQVPCIN